MASIDIVGLLDALAPSVRSAFLAAIFDMRSEARLTLVTSAIERGDVQALIEVLQLDPEFFAPLDAALTAAYRRGGEDAMRSLPRFQRPSGLPVAARFNGRNPRAEQWLLRQSSALITEIISDQRIAVQIALEGGMAQGRNPRSVALEIVGRINRATKRREGGIVGLTSQQTGYVTNMRAELRDPERMANYFTRQRRDRRFDSVVSRALREGRPVPQAKVDQIASRYADRLLKLRGDTIARTELLQSLHAAQDEAIRQVIDAGFVSADQIARKWDAAEDAATRPSHAAMDGQRAGVDGVFQSGDGYLLRYPGDRSLGAPAGEIINCRCRVVIDIDFLRELEGLTPAERAAALAEMRR